MFNRSTKLTALLVAAASVASMTPVMAAEKLNQKDGTIKNAVAYDGGKYAYYGYKNKDDDDTGIWYNAGSKSDKDKMINDLEEYEIKEKYGTKYAYVTEDGNKDEYLVDLSTGKIADDETAEDKESAAKGKLISALKKAERYNKTSDNGYEIEAGDVETQRLFKNQFGDVWYSYATTGASITSDGAITITTTGAPVGFTNEKGKYIDVAYTADLKVYSARKNKAVVIEKYGKTYQDEALRVNLKSVKPLAQDKDNIYVLTEVGVDYFINTHEKDKNGNEKDNTYDFNINNGKFETRYQFYIQKISKTQGDKEDGAYIPKTISSYLVASDKVFDDGDLNDAYNALMGYKKDVYDYYNYTYSVINNDLYVVGLSESDFEKKGKVKVTKISLGKGKYNLEDKYEDFVEGENGLNENDKNRDDIDLSVAKKSKDDEMDVEKGKNSVSIDVNGNVWAIDHGKISMFDKDEFKQQYSTDRSYNRLDVYDKNSLIAWEDEKDSYTTVQEGKAQTVSDAQVIDPNLVDKTTVAPAHKPGWEKQANGVDWKFYDAAGNESINWIFVGNAWYYIDPTTKLMKTGWVRPKGEGTPWYYLDPASGAMKTGWFQDTNGLWYYLDPASGAMKTGWFQDYDGTWYYLYSDGSMAKNTYVGNYWLNEHGAWVK